MGSSTLQNNRGNETRGEREPAPVVATPMRWCIAAFVRIMLTPCLLNVGVESHGGTVQIETKVELEVDLAIGGVCSRDMLASPS